MAAPRQKVWDSRVRRYRDGPDLVADNKSFPKYCGERSISKAKRHRLKPTTASNDYSRGQGLLERRRLAPHGNDFAGFKSGDVSSELWVTSYPFMGQAHNRLSDDTVLFHVHLSAEAIAEPAATGWFSSWFFGFGAEPPQASPWRTPITRLQIAPTSTNHHDVNDYDDAQVSSVVANEGPILRSNIDVLYLDKTFWQHYFNRIDRKIDVLVPGVFPSDLAQVQRVAIDIAVLRNKDEFAAVARAVGRHLPNVTSFSAVVTKIIPRAVDGPREQIALLENGLPDVFVSFNERVRLGVHEAANLIPSQGIVSANLKRLSLLATPTRVLETQYMLLAYFDDAVQSLEGGSADVDLPNVNNGQRPADDTEAQRDDAETDWGAKQQRGSGTKAPPDDTGKQTGQGANAPGTGTKPPPGPKMPPSRLDPYRRAGRGAPGIQVKGTRRRKARRERTGARRMLTRVVIPDNATNLTTTRPTYSFNLEPPNTGNHMRSRGGKGRGRGGKRGKGDAAPDFLEIQDTGALVRQTEEQLAAQRVAQRPAQQAFVASHPRGYRIIPVSGAGELCAWRAIEASWRASLPRIAQATGREVEFLSGVVTVATLNAAFTEDRRSDALRQVGVTADRNFTADHAARTFGQVVRQQLGVEIELGWFGPMQQMAWGGNNEDLVYVLLGVPNEPGLPPPDPVCRIWFWNNNEPLGGHYDGVGDAIDVSGNGSNGKGPPPPPPPPPRKDKDSGNGGKGKADPKGDKQKVDRQKGKKDPKGNKPESKGSSTLDTSDASQSAFQLDYPNGEPTPIQTCTEARLQNECFIDALRISWNDSRARIFAANRQRLADFNNIQSLPELDFEAFRKDMLERSDTIRRACVDALGEEETRWVWPGVEDFSPVQMAVLFDNFTQSQYGLCVQLGVAFRRPGDPKSTEVRLVESAAFVDATARVWIWNTIGWKSIDSQSYFGLEARQ